MFTVCLLIDIFPCSGSFLKINVHSPHIAFCVESVLSLFCEKKKNVYTISVSVFDSSLVMYFSFLLTVLYYFFSYYILFILPFSFYCS